MAIGKAGARGGTGSLGALGKAQGPLASLYLGQVATRSYIPNGAHSSATKCMTRTAHFSRDAISSVQIVIPGFYVQTVSSSPAAGGNNEIAAGSDVTATASIEYNDGSFSPNFTFGGSGSGTVPSGGMLTSDALAVTIPTNTKFYVRIYRTGLAGTMVLTFVNGPTGAGAAVGDGLIANTVATDMTQGGVVTSAGTLTMTPVAIIAQTRKASVYLVGDSRCMGSRDVFDATGDTGELARSIGPTLAYINAGIPANTVTGYNASHTNMLSLAQYCSHVISQGGINDLRTGLLTSAQMMTQWQSLWALFGGKPVYQSGVAPATSSTDSFQTVGAQTTHASNPQRTGANDLIRAVPSPLAGYFEVPDVVESSRNSGLWQADGVTAQKYTSDGLHEQPFSYLLVKTSGAINPALFTR
jgi:hypothetical protein